jgi:hypothetical protein
MSKEPTKAEMRQQLRQQNDVIKQLKADLRAEQLRKAPAEKIITKRVEVPVEKIVTKTERVEVPVEKIRVVQKPRKEDTVEIARLRALLDRMEREANAK